MPGNMDKKICGSCKLDLENDGDHTLCSACLTYYHFGDCSIKKTSWKGLGDERRGTWICQSCRAKTRIPSQSNERDDITSLDIASKLDLILEMRKDLNDIKISVEFMSNKHDEFMMELKTLREENKVLKEENKELKRRQVITEDRVRDLDQRLNELDMYGRRVNLEIFGASVQASKAQDEDTEAVVRELAKKIGITYKAEEIHKLHRLQARKDGKPPTILVQFHSTVVRDAWLQKGKKARLIDDVSGKGVFFNENLTNYYKGLLREAKIRAAMHNHKFVWPQGGKILVRKSERERNVIVIKSAEDLDKII